MSVNNAGQQSFTTDFETAWRVSRSINAAGDKIVFSGAPCGWRDPCVVGGVYRNCLCPDPDGECEADCDAKEQIYLRVLAGASSRTYRVSRTYVEGQGFLPGNDDSQVATIALDAFLIAWSSTATNFPGDTDSREDVFLMECCDTLDNPNMTPLRVSRPLGGNPANGDSAFPLAWGHYVAFESTASNLVEGDTNGVTDVFVVYRHTLDDVRRFSVASDGAEANGYSWLGGFTGKTALHNGDGGDLAVVLVSAATNLVPGDTNGKADVSVSQSRRLTRGDAEDDGDVDRHDREYVLEYLFQGGDPPHCFVAADRNDDGQLNISDTMPCTECEPAETCCVPEPKPPNYCGLNFTSDPLPCESSLMCQ